MKLSIITINYNNLEGLKKTFDSVFNQSFQDFEYIVIDGGSTDGSKEFIENNAEHISYWVSEPDKGIYNAMNKGIKVANGEYLLFLNSGDYLFEKSSILMAYPFLDNKDLIIFDISLDYNDYKKTHHYPTKYTFNYFRRGSLGHPTTIINKNMFLKYGLYNEENSIVSDWEFFILLFINNVSFIKVNEVLSVFSMDGISSKNRELAIKEMNNIINLKYRFLLEDYYYFEDRIKILEKELSSLKSKFIYRFLKRIKLFL